MRSLNAEIRKLLSVIPCSSTGCAVAVFADEICTEITNGLNLGEMEESLLVLPFSYTPDLLTLFNEYIQLSLEVELICRCLFFLLRIHFGQITSNQMLLTVIDSLRKNTFGKINEMKDVTGFNMAGLQLLQREIEAKEDVTFFADATERFKEKKRKRKIRDRAVLVVV